MQKIKLDCRKVMQDAICALRASYPERWLAIWDSANDTLIHGYRGRAPEDGWIELYHEGWKE